MWNSCYDNYDNIRTLYALFYCRKNLVFSQNVSREAHEYYKSLEIVTIPKGKLNGKNITCVSVSPNKILNLLNLILQKYIFGLFPD